MPVHVNWDDDEEDDPMLAAFLDAIISAEDAAGSLVNPYQRALAWAAIASAYAQTM
jgi:hypothetical protein